MARAPLLQLSDISLTFGGDPVFTGLDLVIQPGDRIALVGRNGSGKSTLMKVMAGLVEVDKGLRVVSPGASVGYMEQDPDLSGFATLGEFAAAGLPANKAYRVGATTKGLKLNPDISPQAASGGERRRAGLARILAAAPELMLLDEPTNHLDTDAILWLENQLRQARQAYILVSHDRAFLRNATQATLWIDRGAVRRREQGGAGFEAWRDEVWRQEDDARRKMDRKIKAEAHWAVEGITARRKRNMGRLRALQQLRAERASMIQRQGTAGMVLQTGPRSGRLVIEAKNISKTYEKPVVRDFSIRILRGDRVAFVGPNGAGKTTILKMLTGRDAPDQGVVRLGKNLIPAIFDQDRATLDPDMTLWSSLAGDPDMRVSGKADQVMVRGRPRHVIGYLKEFLFDTRQARGPVRSLSGGEKARLLLAKLMARESNLLVLDEPTNDLDVETLDLLQELLDGYDGTVLLVSHDRDFLDRVATVTVALEGAGRATVYAGGWSDYQAQRRERSSRPVRTKPAPRARKDAQRSATSKPALSYAERCRLDELPGAIARLEAEIARLEAFLSQPALFTEAPKRFQKAVDGLVERQAALTAAEEEWLKLEEKAAG